MKLIIAGGRDYVPRTRDKVRLSILSTAHRVTEVVSGTARGADTFGEEWAKSRRLPVRQFPADWETHGRGAGHVRNRQMAKYADAVVLLPGGRGTANMKEQAEKLGLLVFDWRNDT